MTASHNIIFTELVYHVYVFSKNCNSKYMISQLFCSTHTHTECVSHSNAGVSASMPTPKTVGFITSHYFYLKHDRRNSDLPSCEDDTTRQ